MSQLHPLLCHVIKNRACEALERLCGDSQRQNELCAINALRSSSLSAAFYETWRKSVPQLNPRLEFQSSNFLQCVCVCVRGRWIMHQVFRACQVWAVWWTGYEMDSWPTRERGDGIDAGGKKGYSYLIPTSFFLLTSHLSSYSPPTLPQLLSLVVMVFLRVKTGQWSYSLLSVCGCSSAGALTSLHCTAFALLIGSL